MVPASKSPHMDVSQRGMSPRFHYAHSPEEEQGHIEDSENDAILEIGKMERMIRRRMISWTL
jgi:hypothetical protein